MAIINHHPTGFIRRQQPLIKLAGQRGGFGVQAPELRFIVIAKLRAGKYKTLVDNLHKTQRLGIQRQRLPLSPDRIHTRKERTVEINIICQRRQFSGKGFIKAL